MKKTVKTSAIELVFGALDKADQEILNEKKRIKEFKAKRDKRIAKKVAKIRWKESQRKENPQFTKRGFKPRTTLVIS